MNRCAGWLFVLCALFITFDVLARKFLGFSSESTTELSGYMLGVGIGWGLAGALERARHVRIDMLIQKLPPRIRGWLHWLALALLAVFAGFLAYGAWHHDHGVVGLQGHRQQPAAHAADHPAGAVGCRHRRVRRDGGAALIGSRCCCRRRGDIDAMDRS